MRNEREERREKELNGEDGRRKRDIEGREKVCVCVCEGEGVCVCVCVCVCENTMLVAGHHFTFIIKTKSKA